MKVEEIAKLVNATIHHVPEDFDVDISYAGATDLMSDVLAYMGEILAHSSEGMMLITGLVRPQVVRTATLIDMSVIVFTRGKIPTRDVIDEAKSSDVAVLSTALTSYSVSGILYSAGIL